MSTAPLPDALLAHARPVPVRAGEVVFRRGAAAASVYRVRAGAVRLLRHGRDGEEIVLHEARRGDFFAEASLDATRYHCDAVAVAAGELDRIPAEPLRRLLRTDPDFSRAWASLLARQLRATRARLERLSLRTASERVRHLLSTDGVGPACEVRLRGTLKDLARELGLTHESLYRTLARMEADGVLERGEGVLRFRPAPVRPPMRR